MYIRRCPVRTSNYKRIHHFHERISQMLLMESEIPNDQMLQIARRLLDGTYECINKDSVRAVLRSLNMAQYIEKWLQIIFFVTGVKPPAPGPIVLDQLDRLFIDMQRPFNACKTEARRNFLNYNYVFCRLFQKLNCAKFSMFFPLIRSKAKLDALDNTWTAMASSLGWECPPLQRVAPFSVRLDQPAILLYEIEQRVASKVPAEPRKAPVRTEFRTWDRRRSEWHPPKRALPRSERLEQRPPTLALKLTQRKQRRVEQPQ